MESTTNFNVTQSGYTIDAHLTVIGNDLLIEVTGGDHPHIGTVTMVTDENNIQTIRYPSHDGRYHKDDFISTRIAKKISGHISGTATITAGVHVNQISKQQIAAAAPMSDSLADQIVDWLAQHPISVSAPEYYKNNQQPR